MNREIKFRAWDTFNKRMVYDPYYFRDNFDKGLSHEPEWQVPYQFAEQWQDVDDGIWRPCQIMQYTGLKDKNGKEIYHKDRIRFTINFSDEKARAYWSEDCFIGEVYWKDYGWSVNNISFEKMYDQDYVFRMQDRDFDKRLLDRYSKIRVCEFNEISNIEVIGNIYSNPDLLKL